jgi:hypothetical protein
MKDPTLNMNKPRRFHGGQKIRVVAGTTDPDYGFLIENWSGVIEDPINGRNGDLLYEIRWDSDTLERMGHALHKKCMDDNLDVRITVLAEQELEPADTAFKPESFHQHEIGPSRRTIIWLFRILLVGAAAIFLLIYYAQQNTA